MSKIIYTIGYSSYGIDEFVSTLLKMSIEVLVDVRTNPFSKYRPEFDKEKLKNILNKNCIKYLYLGKELGGRPEGREYYKNGKVSFELLSESPIFMKGLRRLSEGANVYTIVLMCAEKDPLNCHRGILISKKLHMQGNDVNHILEDGNIETMQDMEERLLRHLKLEQYELFPDSDTLLSKAYRIQEAHVSYQVSDKSEEC